MSGSDRFLDPGTARAINTGRESARVLLRTAQKHLQRVFIVFLGGLFFGYIVMRQFVWPALKQTLITNPQVSVVYRNPADVFLIQFKIGLFTGVVFALPLIVYYARGPLEERDILPDLSVSWRQLTIVGVAAVGLLVLGTTYAYVFFFPILMGFLANNAVSASLTPMYGLIRWTRFILYLTVSFGIVSEVPLIMGGLSYSGLVPYETFRAYWKHTFVVIWACGAIFTPPDVFTQTLWAIPVSVLYAISLYVSKVATMVHRGNNRVTVRSILVDEWHIEVGAAAVSGGAGYTILTAGLPAWLTTGFERFVSTGGLATIDPLVGGVGCALAGVAFAGLVVVYRSLAKAATAETALYDGAPDPENVDLSVLDAEGVRAAPVDRFEVMDEDEAVELAGASMEADAPDKARAILDRYDAVSSVSGGPAGADGESSDSHHTHGDTAGGDEEGNVLTRTGSGIVDAFTEDEETEDALGGYYHDISFILKSLRSRAFVIVGWFMFVLSVVFYYLYTGALGRWKRNFIGKLPHSIVAQSSLRIVTLHPVEALVFEAKFSIVIAAILTIPVILFYLWPALKERGVTQASRHSVALWFVGLAGALLAGSALGYYDIGPWIFSWLVLDAHQSNMVVTWRVSSFLWLVFLTTMGIGLFADVPMALWLLYLTDIVSFEGLMSRWRVGVLICFVASAIVTPNSIYKMLLIAIPFAGAFLVGLGLLYVVTLGGRRESTSTDPEF